MPQPLSAGVGGGVRDVDDAYALLHLLSDRQIHVVAVSTVFGNANVEAVTKATRALLKQAGHTGVPVYRGAKSPEDSNTTASRRMRAWLDAKSGTIVALGALTNVAAALRGRPDLQEYAVDELVAVAGRRPGASFAVGELGGGGLSDMNFEKDWEAFAEILRGFAKVVLTPFELSKQVRFTAADVATIGERRSWLAAVTAPWLDFWESEFGVDYFHPFDLLASAYVLNEARVTDDLVCDEDAQAWVVRAKSDAVTEKIAAHVEGDGAVHGIGAASKMYLHVGDLKGAPVAATAKRSRNLVYCHGVADGVAAKLVHDVATPSSLRRDTITHHLPPGAPQEL